MNTTMKITLRPIHCQTFLHVIGVWNELTEYIKDFFGFQETVTDEIVYTGGDVNYFEPLYSNASEMLHDILILGWLNTTSVLNENDAIKIQKYVYNQKQLHRDFVFVIEVVPI